MSRAPILWLNVHKIRETSAAFDLCLNESSRVAGNTSSLRPTKVCALNGFRWDGSRKLSLQTSCLGVWSGYTWPAGWSCWGLLDTWMRGLLFLLAPSFLLRLKSGGAAVVSLFVLHSFPVDAISLSVTPKGICVNFTSCSFVFIQICDFLQIQCFPTLVLRKHCPAGSSCSHAEEHQIQIIIRWTLIMVHQRQVWLRGRLEKDAGQSSPRTSGHKHCGHKHCGDKHCSNPWSSICQDQVWFKTNTSPRLLLSI